MERFLLVTDSAAIAEDVSVLLEGLVGPVPLEVLHEDGKLALARIESRPPNLVILPLSMRRMEALTLLRVIGPEVAQRVLLMVPDTLDGFRVAWEALCLGVGDILPTKGRPAYRLKGNRDQRVRQFAIHLDRGLGWSPTVPTIETDRPWLLLPEVRHLLPMAAWLEKQPRDFPIVMRVPEGPRLRRVVAEELGRMTTWAVRDLANGDRLAAGQVHVFSDPDLARFETKDGRWSAQLSTATCPPGSWSARAELLQELSRSAGPLGILSGEGLETEEADLLGNLDCEVRSLDPALDLDEELPSDASSADELRRAA